MKKGFFKKIQNCDISNTILEKTGDLTVLQQAVTVLPPVGRHKRLRNPDQTSLYSADLQIELSM